jgi:membrane associated rhomboid family serine protease
MNIIENIKQTFRQGNAVIKLIYLNGGIFIVLYLLALVFRLFNSTGEFIYDYLAVPSNLSVLLFRPWTLLTYMFLHQEVLHFFFNMMTLFWFGKIFLMYFSEKQLVGLYIVGGFFGALFYIVAFNIFPFFAPLLHTSNMLGASAATMAIILAVALKAPDMELQLMFIGNVKLKYIAAFFVLASVFGITSSNGGGQISHLGGALAGYLFIVSLRQGRDLTSGINRILDSVFSLFGPRKLKVKPNPNRKNTVMNDADFNANKARKMQEIDKILDKIKTSGYESLSAEEKKRLFEQGNKN